MSITERLTEDMKSALKKGDKARLSTIRQLLAQIKDERIAKMRELADDDVIGVLTNAAKRRREAIALYEQGGRGDLVASETAELVVIQEYLPQQLSEAEITDIIDATIAEVGAKGPGDLGKVMGKVMEKVRGRADGKQVQQKVRERLQQ